MATDDLNQKVSAFFSKYPTVEYKKGEILVRAGEEPRRIIYLLQGSVEEYDISPSGDKVVVNVFKPPAFFPMSWAINKTPNDYFFEAATDVVAQLAPPAEAVKFLHKEADVTFDLLKRVYAGTDGLLRRSAHLMGGGAQNRLTFELIVSAKRFGKKSVGGTVIKMTEAELGERTGVSRETVSRELARLKKQGLVSVSRNQILVSDISGLEKNLGSEL